MEMTKGMRLREAKQYVAERLGVDAEALSDPTAMCEVRATLGLGRVVTFEATYPDEASAIEAKFRIAQLLDIAINCVERFKQRAGLAGVIDPHLT
jgi:dimethylamine--corrinoid protein Co-methyltransferase